MDIAVASHIVLDSIQTQGQIVESLGGPICYCGLTAKIFGFEVRPITKVGNDFPVNSRNFLRESKITLKDNQITELPTTRFHLVLNDVSRDLYLKSKCAPLTVDDISNTKTDCWIVSPVIDEIPPPVLAEIIKNGGRKGLVMLDPQGYMRMVDDKGKIWLRDRLDIDISGITAIKTDRSELAALTGGLEGIEGMKKLADMGVNFVIATEQNSIHLLHNNMHYSIKIRKVKNSDSTGAGDILSSAFCCAYLKEKDPLWAICFGAGAVMAALESEKKGIEKIPSKGKIERNASYYYNTIEFQKL